MEFILTENQLNYCKDHAARMAAGARTFSFKHDRYQSEDVYLIGKIGEFGALKLLHKMEKAGRLKVEHIPFRESYDKFDWADDFIVSIGDRRVQIEVRTKGRNVDPRPDYECCVDVIKPGLTYLFVSYNRNTNKVSLLGLASWATLAAHASETVRGKENNNFCHKVTEFNIKIEHLLPLPSL